MRRLLAVASSPPRLALRAAEALRWLLDLVGGVLRRKASPTLSAAGASEDARDTPTPPLAPRFDDGVSRRWHELIEGAKQSGKEVRHCGSLPCAGGACGIASCVCPCDGCDRLAALLARARREVTF